MATKTEAPKRSPRERLLAAANELFYAEGVQTVGIDRIIEHAGVAKASLYNTFGSKEALVRAYLESRHARTLDRLRRAVDRHTDPRARLLAVFDSQGALLAELAEQAGVPDPATLARQLQLIYDGAALGMRTDRDPTVAAVSRAAA